MSIFDGIIERMGYVRPAPAPRLPVGIPGKALLESVPPWLRETGNAEQFSVPEYSLPMAQEELFQRLSWIHIAIEHASNQAAGTPFSVKELEGEEAFDITNHPLELRLRRPNPLQSRFELLKSTFAYYQLTGNAYWWLNRTTPDSEPSEIWMIPSHKIKPAPDGRMFLKGYLYDPGDGQEIPLETWEVVHFKRFHPLNSYVGLSPIEALATVAVGDLQMQAWNTAYFGENNAKPPGALAFADPIADPDWDRMKDEIKKQHGGTKRNLMLLRNVGKGGVEWVATALSQKDMEFLNGRRLNKEEIYEMYAPGLASMLFTNATEANSKVGKTAFMELAVWPMHVVVAEKVTNELLPVYGDNLVAQFDDVRPTDRSLLLSEQAAYERTHTIDEVRQKYYRDKALGDERGALIPGEISRQGNMPGSAVDNPVESDARFGAEPMAGPIGTAKANERDQFVRFAQRRLAEGKAEKIGDFVFKYLGSDEQAAIKSAYQAVDSERGADEYAPLVAALLETATALRETA